MTHSTWKYAVGLTVLVAIGTIAFPCAGQEMVEVELIKNGDMECGGSATILPPYWQAWGTLAGGVTNDAQAGSQALFALNTSGSDWSPTIRYYAPVPPGMTEYKLSFWYKGASWYWELRDETGYRPFADLLSSPTSWKYYESAWRADLAGAAWIRSRIYDITYDTTPIMFDNVSLLVRVPAPLDGIEVLSNGDIELGGSPTTPPTDWNDGNDGVVGVTNDTPDCSSQSLLVFNDGTGAYEGLARQDQVVPPGATHWKLSFSYKGDNPRWHLFDEWHASLGAGHPSDDVPGARQHNVWTDFSTEWQPNTVESGMMRLNLYDIANNAEPAWFDNVSLLLWYPPPQGSVVLIR